MSDTKFAENYSDLCVDSAVDGRLEARKNRLTMSRAPRLQIPGLTFHVVHRGNHRERVFFKEDDYRGYLHLLALISNRYETKIHAYVLMTNHVHLLMTSEQPEGISRTMQQVASAYSRQLNKRLGRQGSLWEGRFRSSHIDSDYYCLACYRYIELNPVRAGIVASPSDYRWSSYRENIGQRAPRIVEPHATFLALGNAEELRVSNYLAIVSEALPASALATIRTGLRLGVPVHSGCADPAETIRIDVAGRRRPGRPRRTESL